MNSLNNENPKEKLIYPYWQMFPWLLDYILDSYGIPENDRDETKMKNVALAARDIHNSFVSMATKLKPYRPGNPKYFAVILKDVLASKKFNKEEIIEIKQLIDVIADAKTSKKFKVEKINYLYTTAIEKKRTPTLIAILGISLGSAESTPVGPAYGPILAADAGGALSGGALGGAWGAVGGAALCSFAAWI